MSSLVAKQIPSGGGLSFQFFRTMIGKKMNARSGNGSASSRKYFLEDGTKGRRRGGRRCGCQEEEEREAESCRWDRTDSECKFTIARYYSLSITGNFDVTILCLNLFLNLFFSLVQSLFWRYESDNIMVDW